MANLKYKDSNGNWKSLSSVKGPKGDSGIVSINGTQTTDTSFYAPIDCGNSGQILKSNGENNAPTWIPQPSLPEINNGTLTIQKNGTNVGSFTANASENSSINIEVPTKSSIVDIIYPIGSIYMSVNDISPQILFGGTWERLEDKFLLGAGNTYTANDTGGNATHTHSIGHTHGVPGVAHTHTTGDHILTVSEIPSHTHKTGIDGKNAGSYNTGVSSAYVYFDQTLGLNTTATGGGKAHNHGNTGSTTPNGTTTNSQSTTTSGSSSNMPPYLVVYMWKRVEDK